MMIPVGDFLNPSISNSFIEYLQNLYDSKRKLHVLLGPLNNGSLIELGFYEVPEKMILEMITLGKTLDLTDFLLEIKHPFKTEKFGHHRRYVTLTSCKEALEHIDEIITCKTPNYGHLMKYIFQSGLEEKCRIVKKVPFEKMPSQNELSKMGFTQAHLRAFFNHSLGLEKEEYLEGVFTTTRVEIDSKMFFVEMEDVEKGIPSHLDPDHPSCTPRRRLLHLIEKKLKGAKSRSHRNKVKNILRSLGFDYKEKDEVLAHFAYITANPEENKKHPLKRILENTENKD